ncbi:MAG TPA: hypothetical protein VGR96_13455 [Acidobacteriaceae bacterium]|nr:hypothetical protein [Acidobacteriaceae bacterium]
MNASLSVQEGSINIEQIGVAGIPLEARADLDTARSPATLLQYFLFH